MLSTLRVERLEDRSTPSAGNVLVTLKSAAAPLSLLPAASSAEAIGFGVFEVTPAVGYTPEAVAAAYMGQPDVADARPDAVVTLERASTDPMVSQQYALTKISAPAAWDVSTGTKGTIVAVIDTGVDYNHPDLSSNLWVNPREIPGNGVDDDRNGFIDDIVGADFANNDGDPMDDRGHGTHAAGIIAANGNNGIGVSGVTWNTRIMSLKFIPASGSGYTSDAVRALNYAVTNGAKVVNASWGGATNDTALQTAVGRAKAGGVIVVASAGNAGSNNDAAAFYPASYSVTSDNVISVGASDQNDNPAGFSNRGATSVSLFAPGQSITSTYPNNRYVSSSGTSMAAPFVTGAVALLWDKNPTWSYRQVIDRILATVDKVPALTGLAKTGGRLDVGAALGATAAAVPPTTPPTTPPANAASTNYSKSAGNVPIAIPDGGTATFWFDVTNNMAVKNLSASLTLEHPYDGDLLIELTAPDGRKVVLANRRGGSGDNFTNTTWTDAAATPISAARAPYAGSFKPETPLSALNGMNARGRWTITVTDKVKGFSGRVTAAKFNLTGTATATATATGETVEVKSAPRALVAMWNTPEAKKADGSIEVVETVKQVRGETRAM